MSRHAHDEFSRGVDCVARVSRAADAAIEECGRRLTRIRLKLSRQMEKANHRRARAAKLPATSFLRERLEREADLIESLVNSIRGVL